MNHTHQLGTPLLLWPGESPPVWKRRCKAANSKKKSNFNFFAEGGKRKKKRDQQWVLVHSQIDHSLGSSNRYHRPAGFTDPWAPL